MAYEIRDNSASAFVNDRKQSENHADYTGNAMVGGTHYFLNLWVKQDKKGQDYFSISFKRKDKQGDGTGNSGEHAPAAAPRKSFSQAPKQHHPETFVDDQDVPF